MAKLKYDRPINVNAGKGQFVTIPKDEVWKVTVTSNIDGADPLTNLYGGGYSFDSRDTSKPVSGIAFKHIDE